MGLGQYRFFGMVQISSMVVLPLSIWTRNMGQVSRSLGENNMYHTSHTLEFYTPLLLIQVVIELSVTCLWNVLRVMGSLRLFT